MTGGDESPCERLRSAARFHADQASWMLRHELDELRAIELRSLRDVAACILSDHMEPPLAQVDTDYRRHHDRLLERRNHYDRKKGGPFH